MLQRVNILPHGFHTAAVNDVAVVAGGDLVQHQTQEQLGIFILRVNYHRPAPQQIEKRFLELRKTSKSFVGIADQGPDLARFECACSVRRRSSASRLVSSICRFAWL